MMRAPQHRLAYLPHLLQEDWTCLFPPLDSRRIYYVYAHSDPSGWLIRLPASLGGIVPTPFYIGKGSGHRAYDLNRNQGHGIKLRQLQEAGAGKEHIVHILAARLTESEALSLESKLIYFFGTIYEKTCAGVLLNLDVPSRPAFGPNLHKAEKLKRQKAAKSCGVAQ